MDSDEIQKLRQQLLAAEQRAEAAEELSALTTFPKFLKLCHNCLSEELRVQTDRSLTTKGSITSPKGKRYPPRLRPWETFIQQQQQHFDTAYSLLHPQANTPAVFTSRAALEDLGRTLCRRALASEKDLESYERFAVEEKVKDIIGQLKASPGAQALLNISGELEFENHLNSLSENAEEVAERQKISRIDQACVFRTVNGTRSLAYVREYKAPHKLTVDYLRAGLRPMNLREEVVQRLTIPQDIEERLNYNADRLVASAVTQTYEYMIENGLEFSSIAIGVAEVFLRVDAEDPETVYYYLAEPQLDVGEGDEFGFRYPFTSISRLLAFTLMAMRSEQRSQAWRTDATKSLRLWREDFDAVLHSISPEERGKTPPSSVYRPPRYPINLGSPCLTRRRALAAQNRDGVELSFQSTSSSSEGSVSESNHRVIDLSSLSRGSRPAKRKRNSTQSTGKGQRSRQYCTQQCLLGLKLGQALDLACPNVKQHRRQPADQFHDLHLRSFHRLLHAQLVADMDHDCQPLGKQGARGALFKITLVSHGYTFVAKGTVAVFVSDLRHEGRIYDQLLPLQGSAVTVYLGNIDLQRTYFLDVGVKIIHMMLMAWGGISLSDQKPQVSAMTLEQEKQRSMNDIRKHGVVHNDLRPPNILWNASQARAMLIDFERAVYCSEKRTREPCKTLREISPNKKPRFQEPKSAPNFKLTPARFRKISLSWPASRSPGYLKPKSKIYAKTV